MVMTGICGTYLGERRLFLLYFMMRVIVLDDSEIVPDPSQKTEKTMFEAISLNTRGFRFDRDEANAR
jgi:hypothetical protein